MVRAQDNVGRAGEGVARPPRATPLTGLAAEIGKRTPFAAPEVEAFLNLLRTTTQFNAEVERLLRQHGLSSAGYNILRILRGTREHARAEGSTRIGKACHEIAEDMITVVPDVTRLVDRLEADGLAERTRCASDRRVVYVSITIRGLELLAKIDEPLLRLHRAQLGHLGTADLAKLNELMVRARTGGVQRADAGPTA